MVESEQTIETTRLCLRRYVNNDRLKFIELNTDPAVREKMDGALDVDRATKVFDRVKAESLSLAVIEKSSERYFGHIYISESVPGYEGEIGFLFFPIYWGFGYATEAAGGLIEYLKSKTGYRKLVATIDIGHEPSIKVLEKLGFTLISKETDNQGVFLVYELQLKA